MRTANENQNLEKETKAIVDYCKNNNLTISDSDIYIDENMPASNCPNMRPVMQQMITKLKSENVDVLVVYRIDHLFRKLVLFLEFQQFLKENNIQLVSVKESVDCSTTTGNLMSQIILSISEHERELIEKRGCEYCNCGA
jgi:DNA invertase Pin-like site-specific DNA recombinase